MEVGSEAESEKSGTRLETRSLLCLGGNPGAPKGAKLLLEKDSPRFGWGLGSQCRGPGFYYERVE